MGFLGFVFLCQDHLSLFLSFLITTPFICCIIIVSSLFSLFCRRPACLFFIFSKIWSFCDLMSKKMKGVSLESSSYGVFEDSKARLKRQILFQDYQDLHKVKKKLIFGVCLSLLFEDLWFFLLVYFGVFIYSPAEGVSEIASLPSRGRVKVYVHIILLRPHENL